MEHIVYIEKIITGGAGLARLDNGQVLMSEFVLPGETVRIRVQESHTGYVRGELLEILTPSLARREPGCDHYRDCGGCDMQHTEYDEQLRIKKEIVRESMERARVNLPAAGLEDVLPSPESWGYRTRLRLKVDAQGRLGFFQKESNRFVEISSCPVATEPINRAIRELRTSECLRELQTVCREIELLQSPDDQALSLILLLDKGREDPKIAHQAVTRWSELASIDSIGCKAGSLFTQLVPGTAEALLNRTIRLENQHCVLSWSGGCFSQVNSEQNDNLIRLVCALAGGGQDSLAGKTVLDLYCGMGNFSIPLALLGASVTGIEQNRDSIRWAEFNARNAGQEKNSLFYAMEVQVGLRQLTKERQEVDIIILDPPRRGIGKAVDLLARLDPQKIIYISCDPATLARDISRLGKGGYTPVRIIPVDMFPQTHHIETVVLLEK